STSAPSASTERTSLNATTLTKETPVHGGGQPNLQQLMQQAQKMQQQLAEAQAELASSEITGTAGGGLVTVTMTGGGEVRSVKIDPTAVDQADIETLEDVVVAPLANAGDNARKLAEEKMGPLAQGLGGLSGGLGLPGM